MQLTGANNTTLEDHDISLQSLRQIGNTGLYMKSAKPFSRRNLTPVSSDASQNMQKMSYGFAGHGMVVNVDYTNNADTELTLDRLRQQIRQRLDEVEGLKKIQMTEKPLHLGEVQGVHYIVRYKMVPFGKQVNYQVVAALHGSKVWVICTSNKDCDLNGQRQLSDMLESISIPLSN